MVREAQHRTYIRYVSNAGFWLAREGAAVGIDVFCTDQEGRYRDAPQALKEELMAQISSGACTHLFFTHEHSDHFVLADTLRACRENPALQIWGNEAVIRQLREAGAPLRQLHVLSPRETISIASPPLRVKALHTLHEGARYETVDNLCLLIEAGDLRLAFLGDAAMQEAVLAEVAAWCDAPDWLVAPFPFAGLRRVRKMLRMQFRRIGGIFACHLPRPEADTEGWLKGTKAVLAHAADGLPAPVMPERFGEWYLL